MQTFKTSALTIVGPVFMITTSFPIINSRKPPSCKPSALQEKLHKDLNKIDMKTQLTACLYFSQVQYNITPTLKHANTRSCKLERN